MKLLILGATGEIGSAVARAALANGHEVTAFVRSPDKLGDLRDRVRVVQGDLADPDAISRAVGGQGAVISAVGSSPDTSQVDLPATGMRHTVAAMGPPACADSLACPVEQSMFLVRGSPSAGGSPPPFVRLMARYVVEAKQREFDVVHASDLDWTMVRPPRVVPGEPTGNVEVSDSLRGFQIASGDVGEAMVSLASGNEWLRQAPYLSARRR